MDRAVVQAAFTNLFACTGMENVMSSGCRMGMCAALLSALVIVSPARARADEVAGAALPIPLRLDDVLRVARAERSEVAAAKARARAAAYRPAAVSSLEDPVISPSIDHLPFSFEGVDWSVAIEQRFPLSGVRSNKRRVAEAEAAGLHADVGRVELDVEREAVAAFFMLHERRAGVAVLEQQLALAGELGKAALSRYSSGAGSQADVLRADLEIARLEGEVASMQAEVRAAEAMLNTMLGRDALAPVPPLQAAAVTAAPPEWSVLRQGALQRRPELEVGRAQVRRAEAEVTVMESMYAPMMMVRGGPSYTDMEGAGLMLMVGVSVPLWGDSRDAAVHEAQAMTAMTRADLAAMSRMVEGQLAVAQHQVLAARVRYLRLRDDVLPRAQRVIEPSLAGYATGATSLVAVIEAVQASWSIQRELITAESELGLAWAALERAAATRAPQP